MRSSRRWMGPMAAVAAVVLGACNWTYVEPLVVDGSFGDDGVITLASDTGFVTPGTTMEGGLLVQGAGSLLRFGADGRPDPRWTPPDISEQVQAVQGLRDGSVTAVTYVGGTSTVRRYASDGSRIDAGDVTVEGPSARPAMSPYGYLTTAKGRCTPEDGCSAVEVHAFAVDGSERFAATVPMDVTGSNCRSGLVTAYARPLDNGTVMVAQARCSATLGAQTASVVVRRLTRDGEVDESYGEGAGHAIVSSSASQVVISHTGHVLVVSTGFQLRRLDALGTADTTFGVRSALSYLDGRLLDAVVPNGTGYTLTPSTSFDDNACSPSQPAVVVNVDERGVATSSSAIPASIGGSVHVLRHVDGDQVVFGLHQAFEASGGGIVCTAPRTYRFMRLVTPDAS